MTRKSLLTVLPLVLAIVFLFPAAHANAQKLPYKLIATIPVPPDDLAGGFDISWADSESGRYYLANRGNAATMPPVPPHIDVVDTRHNKLLDPLPLNAGANGVVAIRRFTSDLDVDGTPELWVGDAMSFIEVIDLTTGSNVANISTGGTARADELAYDPLHQILMVANDLDPIPFVTFISTRTRAVLGTLAFPQVVFGAPATGHGLEQPVWDAKTRKFYLAVPATNTNPTGEVDEIDPLTMDVTDIFPTTCNPAGLALVPHQYLVTSCGDVVNVKTGGVVTTIAGAGGDEIWFNPGDDRVYFGNFFAIPVVDTDTWTLLTTIPVGQAVPPPVQFTHSVAADSVNNRIFVPVSNAGIKVYHVRKNNP
jgi:hypothetical protein